MRPLVDQKTPMTDATDSVIFKENLRKQHDVYNNQVRGMKKVILRLRNGNPITSSLGLFLFIYEEMDY